MSSKVTFDYSKATSFVSENEVDLMKKITMDAKETLVSKTGAGNDFLGWIDLPVAYDKEEFARIKRQQPRSRAIQRYCLSSVSAVLTLVQEQRSNSCVTASIT